MPDSTDSSARPCVRCRRNRIAIVILVGEAGARARPLWRPGLAQPRGHVRPHCRQHGVSLRLRHPPGGHGLGHARLAGRHERVHNRVERHVFLARNLRNGLTALKLDDQISLIDTQLLRRDGDQRLL